MNSCSTRKLCKSFVKDKPILQGIDCEFPFPYVAQWYQYQQNYVNELDTCKDLETPFYRDTATVSAVEPYKSKTVLEENAKLSLYGNRIQAGKQTLFFADIRVITVLGKNKLNIYHTDGIYQIKGDSRFNALKYMNIYYRNKNQQAGEGDFLGI